MLPALVLLAGCMRGCPNQCGGGEPATACKTDGDCEDKERCRDGYCMAPETIESLNRCLGTDECKQRGACSAGLTRSFLGASSQPTCLVERAEDCAASTLCAEQGKCALARTGGALDDGYCAAREKQHCTASKRCQSHDECTLDGNDCTRSWTDCAGDPLPGFGTRSELGGEWKPEDVSDAILACRLEDKYKQTISFVRSAGRCVRGPNLGSSTPFLFRTRIDTSGRIEVAIQADARRGTYRDAGYVRATYAGTSPFSSGDDLPKLTCHVVPEAVARKNAAIVIVRAQGELTKIKAERPKLEAPSDLPRAARSARAEIDQTAAWLGASDPQVVKLRAALDAALVEWRRSIDGMIAKLAPTDEGGLKGSKLRVHALICGDALRTRAGSLADGKQIAADHCGVELAIRNETREQSFGGSFLGDIAHAHFLRRGAEAGVIDAVLIDAHTAAKPKPEARLTLPAGEEAFVLLAPASFDLALGKGKPDAGAVLVGDDFMGKERVVLRLDR